MKLPMVVSPATWDLIERLRPDLDVAIDVFDVTLAPLLPESSHAWAVRLREVAEDREPERGRARLLGAVKSGRHLLFSEGGLRIGLFPIRYHRDVAGVLAAAIGERRATIPFPSPEAPDLASSSRDDSLDRRIERIGWSLRAALEADIALWEKLDQAEHRARLSDSTMRFFEYLHSCSSEGELFAAVVQAAAVWGDFDARVYRRTLNDCYVLDAALPLNEGDAAPAAFDASMIEGKATPVRVTSIAELEQLGWPSGVGEVVLLPVGPPEHPTMWLLALAGTPDERFASVFGMLARTLSVRVEQLLLARTEQYRRRLQERLVSPQPGVPAAAAMLLNELLAALPAAQARLLARDPASGSLRQLASVGGALFGAFPGPAPVDRLRMSPERIILPLRVDAGAHAVLDLTASLGAPFSAADAFVARKLGAWVETWLAGAWRGLSTGAQAPFSDRPRFEQRLEEELDRARRYRQEAGLLVVRPRRVDAEEPLKSPVAEALRSQLRTTDLLGLLEDGRLAALLVHTGPEAIDAVADRVEERLRPLRTTSHEDCAAVGRAAFPSGGETAAALVSAADEDMARRRTGRPKLAYSDGQPG